MRVAAWGAISLLKTAEAQDGSFMERGSWGWYGVCATDSSGRFTFEAILQMGEFLTGAQIPSVVDIRPEVAQPLVESIAIALES